MISFREAQDAVERVAQLLKSVEALQSVVDHALSNLGEFRTMMEYSHAKRFTSPSEAVAYIDKVLIPQMAGIHDALASGSVPHLKNLKQANDQCQRLVLNLQMLTEGLEGGLIP
ncbi:MAG: hypothetical protein ACRDHY_04080 [Anaerolineales bacterium]